MDVLGTEIKGLRVSLQNDFRQYERRGNKSVYFKRCKMTHVHLPITASKSKSSEIV